MRQPLTLKARAIALLAQREHSAAELRGKLRRIARQRLATQAKAAAEAAETENEAEPNDALAESADPAEEVETLLAWLQSQGYLDESRFVESRVHVRAQRFGLARIKQELAQHGLALDTAQQDALKQGELTRARAIWRRKFGSEPASDAAARARQIRFLAGRGFSGEVIHRLLRAAADDDEG